MNVVVVESPAKAKTINKYLGPEYTVLASYGHVRDLPAKDGSVRPDDAFDMVWAIDPKAKQHLDAIAKALKGAGRLYLATDPDREGEAISWHVCQVLKEKHALNGIDIKRVVFNEITRGAILDAFERPRDLDEELISAYLARRALDYLVGFTLSPVLWRKLPGSRSAGRVQSVALRLVCDRETEIEAFRAQEYWTVKGLFRSEGGGTFTAQLTHLDGRKLDKFTLGDASAAAGAVAAAEARAYVIGKVERKETRRHPAPPFITSTLQQEASRKLGFSATATMRIAQRLYEGVNIGGETVGLITYMRTDGVQMAQDAIKACRSLIDTEFGARYLPAQARLYKTKAKNAQEAHEAIRPTDVARRPADIAASLEPDQLKLYTLIWKRTLASQMESAVLDQVTADVVSADQQVIFRATGSVIAFDGFLKLYREDRDDPERDGEQVGSEDGAGRPLPDLKQGAAAERIKVEAEQHFTQPPPRYTEASLVKRLEELGIGRPSTYASILQVLQDRKYVRLEAKRFVPEDRGRLVTAFLANFFERYVAYGFTAEMEQRLDDVSGGRIDWKSVLSDFWRDFSAATDDIKGLRIKEVLDALDEHLGPHFFRAREDGSDPRACPSCPTGRLSLKLGRFGAFIGCSNYPECRYTRPLALSNAENGADTAALGGNGRALGSDPATGLAVSLRKGPYGVYVQLGDGAKAENGDAAKPKRTSLPADVDPDALDLDRALAYLALPRTVGRHPETGEDITAGIGRFGPFLKMGSRYASLRKGDDVLSVGINRAVDLLARRKPAAKALRTIGAHPGDGAPIALHAGRYGPYIQHGATRVTLPKDAVADQLDVEAAVALLLTKAKVAAKPAASGKKAGTKARTPAKKERISASATKTTGGEGIGKRTKAATGTKPARAAKAGTASAATPAAKARKQRAQTRPSSPAAEPEP